MSIQIENISRNFGTFKALDHVDLTIDSGELVALLGPSGSGKTTLLRIIAGLEEADEGVVRFHGEDATDKHVKERGVGFVFQHYALFKHMSVFENVAFGLRVRPKKTRPGEEEIKRRVHELLELVQLDWLHDRYPVQLSGGQRQRIALARALAVEPRVLLLDEPFGALDAKVRAELRRWLRRLHDEIHITSVFVTHDQEEALEVADKIVVMNKGRIEQVGTPEEVYDKPANPFVYSFLGNVNLFHGRVEHGKLQFGQTQLDASGLDHEVQASAFVRPHEVTLSKQATIHETVAVTVLSARIVGPLARVELRVVEDGVLIEAEVDKEHWKTLREGAPETLFAGFKNHRIYTQSDGFEDYVI